MKQVITENVRHPIKIWTDSIEDEARAQLLRLGNMPFIFKHVAVMPDCHHGKGSTIGSVIATKDAIIPAAVGVDIGCGMSAVKLPGVNPNDLGKLSALREAIENIVPVGFAVHSLSDTPFDPSNAQHAVLAQGAIDVIKRAADDKSGKIVNAISKMIPQLGTLGGGNHFIEICVSKKEEVWLMLHSGSRGVGNLIAQYHIAKAKGLMKDLFIDLPDMDLSYFARSMPEFEHYMQDMLWAQRFAFLNRSAMRDRILRALMKILGKGEGALPFEPIDCHHNYVSMENHFNQNVLLTRKGAVNAEKGKLGIIPGSMGTKSYIVRGLGNQESFNSCSHGAGRTMSRTQAKKLFTIEDLRLQTQGVDCLIREETIDEIPSAYKDIDAVMENQKDLVEIVEELKQVVCVKG